MPEEEEKAEEKPQEEEEPKGEEVAVPEIPEPVRINEKVEVYDPDRGEWFDARWTIFSAGEYNYHAAIDIDAAGAYVIAPGHPGRRMLITSITLTVSEECNIAFPGISGSMDFGGENEPRGMTLNLGNFYIELPEGSSFSISVSEDVHVGGLVTYVLR